MSRYVNARVGAEEGRPEVSLIKKTNHIPQDRGSSPGAGAASGPSIRTPESTPWCWARAINHAASSRADASRKCTPSGRSRTSPTWPSQSVSIRGQIHVKRSAITARGSVAATRASFAALAIIPVRGFRELAFAMTVGIALETFLVRSVLVPAMVALVGYRIGWPGRSLRPGAHQATG